MKQTFAIAALALFLAAPARADQEVCFDVDSNIRDDNGRVVMERVCVSDERPAPRLRFVDGERQ